MKAVRLSICTAVVGAAVTALLLALANTSNHVQAQDKADGKKLAVEAVAVLKEYCFKCHGEDPQKLKGDLDLFNPRHLKENDRVVAGKPDNSELIVRMEVKDKTIMPPPSTKMTVPPEKIKLLRDWISAGGELPASTTPAAPLAPVDKALVADVRKVFDTYCLKCHGADPQKIEGDLNLLDRDHLTKNDRIAISAPATSLLIQRIKSEKKPMPPSKENNPVPPAALALIVKWIEQGAPALDQGQAPAPTPAPRVVVSRERPVHDKARDILQARCIGCHGGNKPEAGLDLLADVAKLQEKGAVVPTKPGESGLIERVIMNEDNPKRMPPIPQPKLSTDELDTLRRWIGEGARPAARDVLAEEQRFGEEYILGAVLNDVRKLQQAEEPVERYRYFSLNHLIGKGITESALQAHRDALTLIVNHLSWKSNFVWPEPIEGTKTVFRLNIQRLGWDETPFRRGSIEGPRAACNLYDVALLDYPYGVMSPTSRTYQQLMNEFMMPSGRPLQVRPIPYVRADWFVNVVGRAPLYEDMLQLPMKLQGLEKRLAVDSKMNVEKLNAIRGGTTVSGVSRNNRVVERHEPSNSAYYWMSYDFRSSKGPENMFKYPIDFTPAGGEMIFALPNKLQGYYVADGQGNRIDAAPTDVVTDPYASDKTVRNGYACIRCHETGMRLLQDDVRPALEKIRAQPQFNLNDVMQLYAGQKKLKQHLDDDTTSFEQALMRLYRGNPPAVRNTLDLVSTWYLDQDLNVRTAAAEVGILDHAGVAAQFRNRELSALGLFQLGARGGVVRRDAWEEYYEQVVRELGRGGVAVLPLDGVTRPNYQSSRSRIDMEMKTDRKLYKSGDVLTLTMKNKSKVPVYMELYWTGTEGQIAMVTKDVEEMAPGATMTKKYKIKSGAGKETITCYCCEDRFECGEVCVMPEYEGKGMGDRVIHRQFYRMPANKPNADRPEFDAAQMVKKTIEFNTQE